MCNCKGWDVAYDGEKVWIEPHFCRVVDDCGHVENTLQDAAEQCALWHEGQAKAWRDGTHHELLYYAENGE